MERSFSARKDKKSKYDSRTLAIVGIVAICVAIAIFIFLGIGIGAMYASLRLTVNLPSILTIKTR